MNAVELAPSKLISPNRMLFDVAAPSKKDLMRMEGWISEQCAAMGYDMAMITSICPTTDIWAPGLYARQMSVPKKVLLVGEIHRHAHLNTISQGVALVFSEFGVEAVRAPCSFVSQPGIKRMIFAVEDLVWTTYHPTMKTHVDDVRHECIMDAYPGVVGD
jgi:hypothetical protein